MNLLVALFIVSVVIVGAGFTLLVDTPMRAEERLLHGVVIGVVVVATVGFPIAWMVGMGRGAIVTSTVLCLGVSLFGWGRNPSMVAADFGDLGRRFRLGPREPESVWPVFLLTILSAVVSIRIMIQAYGTTRDGGISVGHLSTFGDWSAHLAYAGSFAYGDNFPPEVPTAVGESFAYHFGIDWFAAMFVPLGVSVPAGLQISTAMLAVALPGSMYLAGVRLVGRRLAAMIAVFVFLAAGGTAALYRFLLDDLIDGGLGVFANLPRTYAFDGFDRNWVDNPITGFLYAQRPTMIGFGMSMVLLGWLWQERDRSGVRTHALAGVLTGLMPVFHVFGFGVLFVMGMWWAVLERTRRWWAFIVPAVAVGVPLVLWQLPENGAEGRELHLGWILGLPDTGWNRDLLDFVWFWFLNTGFFIPLVALALYRYRPLALRWLPIFGLLIIPNVGIWHFWPGNNVKYVVFFLLLGAPLVGMVLADWIDRRGVMRAGAFAMLVTLTLSGGLDVWNAFEGSSGAYPAAYMSGDDILVGEWALANTAPHAVFATANNNVHPIRAISGRRVVSGAPGRLNDLGIDWSTRERDLKTIFGVNEGFDEVIARYEIDYVVLGPEERRLFRPPDAPVDWDPAIFWDAAAPIVYDIGGYTVYDVAGYQLSPE